MTHTGPKRKIIIPKALREQVWICNMGRDFEASSSSSKMSNLAAVLRY